MAMPSPPKPFEIKPRVFIFACDVIRAFPKARLDPASVKAWSQLIASATSAGAHLEEAAAGGTRAHFLSLMRGALREMREAYYWLRIMTATQLTGANQVAPLVEEAKELVAILTAIVRRTYENNKMTNNNDKSICGDYKPQVFLSFCFCVAG
jgi:four helix bundle protein